MLKISAGGIAAWMYIVSALLMIPFRGNTLMVVVLIFSSFSFAALAADLYMDKKRPPEKSTKSLFDNLPVKKGTFIYLTIQLWMSAMYELNFIASLFGVTLP